MAIKLLFKRQVLFVLITIKDKYILSTVQKAGHYQLGVTTDHSSIHEQIFALHPASGDIWEDTAAVGRETLPWP